jgi:hypothetical protein
MPPVIVRYSLKDFQEAVRLADGEAGQEKVLLDFSDEGTIIGGASWPMRSTQEFLRHAIELRSEFFHCCIFAANFTSLSTVQSYLCGD